jgi:hypothetical protein
MQQQFQGLLLTPNCSRCPPHGIVASERKNYRTLQLLMILTVEESGKSLFPVKNLAEAKQWLSPRGKCSMTTTTTTTTKIPHSRIRLGGLGLYLEDHGWSYHHHHIPSLPHHFYSCAKLVITKSLLLPSWASFSVSHKRIMLPWSQESHPIFIFFFSPQDLQEFNARTHHSYLFHPSIRPFLAMAIPKSKSSVVSEGWEEAAWNFKKNSWPAHNR